MWLRIDKKGQVVFGLGRTKATTCEVDPLACAKCNGQTPSTDSPRARVLSHHGPA